MIENVPGPHIRADINLTGQNVGLNKIIRKRSFELSFTAPLISPPTRPPTFALSITQSLSVNQWRASLGLPTRIPKAEAMEAMGINPQHDDQDDRRGRAARLRRTHSQTRQEAPGRFLDKSQNSPNRKAGGVDINYLVRTRIQPPRHLPGSRGLNFYHPTARPSSADSSYETRFTRPAINFSTARSSLSMFFSSASTRASRASSAPRDRPR